MLDIDYLLIFIHYNFEADFPLLEALKIVGSKTPKELIRALLVYWKFNHCNINGDFVLTVAGINRRPQTYVEPSVEFLRSLDIVEGWEYRVNPSISIVYQDSTYVGGTKIKMDIQRTLTIRAGTSIRFNSEAPYRISSTQNLTLSYLIQEAEKLINWK